MKNHKRFPAHDGKEHVYFHEKFSNMAASSGVYLDDADSAFQYLKKSSSHHGHNVHQKTTFDMKLNIAKDHLKAFSQVLGSVAGLEDVRLNFFENLHLDENIFHGFTKSLQKQHGLRKIDVNLRWCKQVTDAWLHELVEALNATPTSEPFHGNQVEEFELWVWNCHQVTTKGIHALFEGLKRFKHLHTVKIYCGGNEHISAQEVQHIFEEFHTTDSIKHSLKKARVAGDHGLDIKFGYPKKQH